MLALKPHLKKSGFANPIYNFSFSEKMCFFIDLCDFILLTMFLCTSIFHILPVNILLETPLLLPGEC